MGREK